MAHTKKLRLWGLTLFWAITGFWLCTAVLSAVAAEEAHAEEAQSAQHSAESDHEEANAPDPPKKDEDLQDEDAEAENGDEYQLFPDQEELAELFEVFGRLFNNEYVSKNGLVDYSTLRRKRSDLLEAMRRLDTLHPAVLMSLSQEQRIAFWINTYNTCTLKLIIDNYPIQPKWYLIFYPSNSIMHITGAWDKVYFRVIGLEYTLKEIRNDLLLYRYKDPRICFALTEGARGGAFLRNEPIVPERLDAQLDEQVRRYLDTPTGLILDKQNNTLYLSNVFNMNKQVFLMSEYAEILKFRARKPDERAWLNFLLKYLPPEEASWLETNDVTIRFISFDWQLNEM